MKNLSNKSVALTASVWLVMLLCALVPEALFAGGIHDVTQDSTDSPVMLYTDRVSFNSFAGFRSDSTNRLYVTIDDVNEAVNIGLSIAYDIEGNPYANTNADYAFRIVYYDPTTGTPQVVHGPFVVTRDNANLSFYRQATFGAYNPNASTQTPGQLDGYTEGVGPSDNMFFFQPPFAGDYSIEFEDVNQNAAGVYRLNDSDRQFKNIGLWDFSVVENGEEVEGRLWSRGWALRTPLDPSEPLTPPECIFNRPFNAEMYSYTDDQFVSKIDFRGAEFQGLTFNIAFNSFGPGDIDDGLEEARKSVTGRNAIQGEHLIFVNPPDEAVFPSGVCGTVITGQAFRCQDDDDFPYCLETSVTVAGQVDILLDFNNNGSADANDRFLVADFPENNATACIPWDGLRGDGTSADFTDTIRVLINYSQGVQHYAAYDVELNKSGFKVSTVRPICDENGTDTRQLFWDDRNIVDVDGNPILPNLGGDLSERDGRDGCDEPDNNCRTWDNFLAADCNETGNDDTEGYGDQNTINTWWYAGSQREDMLRIPVVSARIEGPSSLCSGESITLTARDDASIDANETYAWTGPDVDGATTESVEVSQGGTYCVTVSSPVSNCSNTTCQTIELFDFDIADNPSTLDICFGQSVQLPNTYNASYTFSWTPVTGIDDPTAAQPTFSPLDTTTYTVTITGGGALGVSCVTTRSVTVNVAPQIDLQVSGSTTICEGEETTLTAVNNATTAGNPTYVWTGPGVTNATEASLTVSAAGEYCVTIAYGANCSEEQCVTVDILALEIPAIVTDLFACFGESVQLPVAGNPEYEYVWSPATGIDDITSLQPTFSPDETTVYTVTITARNAAGVACSAVRQLTVTVGDEIGLNVIGGGPICDPTTTFTTLLDDEDATVVVTDPAGNVIAGGPTYTVDVSGSTDYLIVATGEGGCTDTVTFNVQGGPVDISLPDSVLICTGDPLDLEVTNLDDDDQLTYNWVPAELFEPASVSTARPIFIGEPGDYRISVSVANQFDCRETITDIRLIVLDDDAVFSFTPDLACDGQTVSFNYTGSTNFGYEYDFGDGTTSREENPTHVYATPGNYTVTLRSIYPGQTCIEPFAQEVIVVDAVLIAGFTSMTGDCDNGSASITFSDNTTNVNGAALTYAWTFTGADPMMSADANPTVTVSSSGTVTAKLVVTSDEGCVDSTMTDIEVELATVDLQDTIVICPGQTTPLNPNADADLIYTWSPAPDFDANDANPVTGVAGTYSVTVTSNDADFNCENVGTVEVVVADSIKLVVNGPNGPIPGTGNGGTGNGNGGGGNGGELELPTLTTCGEPVELTVDLNANPGVNVEYTDLDGNPLGNGGSITLSPDGRDTVVVVATNEFGCIERDTLVIINNQVNAGIDVGAGGLNFCAAQDTSVSVTNNNPGDVLTYQWEANDIISGPLDGASVDISTQTEGSTELTVMVTNQFGCDTTITVTVTSTPFTPNQFPAVITPCFGEMITINGGTALDGYTYEWTPAGNLDLGDPANPVGTFTEDGDLTVTITDTRTGCSDMQTVTVDVAPEIAFTATPRDTVICAPGSIPVTGQSVNDNVEITWYSDPELTTQVGTGTTFVIEATETGQTYTVYGQAIDPTTGCSQQVISQVSVSDLTASLPGNVLQACTGERTSIFGEGTPNGDLIYIYNPADAVDVTDPNNPIFVGTADQVVNVEVRDPATGCATNLDINVTVTDLTGLIVTADPETIVLGESTTLTVVGCDTCTFEWDVPNGTITPQTGATVTATPGEAGDQVYIAMVTSGECLADVPVTVRVEDPLCDNDHIYVPNVFTPNDDGENDVMRIRSNFADQLTEFLFIIYNRWGQEVYNSTDPLGSWDGTVNGDDLEPDVYGYYLRTTCPAGQTNEQQGNITIMR